VTPTPTNTYTATFTDTPTVTPTGTNTPTFTATPTASPTATPTIPPAALHRYYRVQITSASSLVCGATKRQVNEIKLKWNDAYQTNDKTSIAGGSIGGRTVTVTDTNHYLTSEGWCAFSPKCNWTSDSNAFAVSSPYDSSVSILATLDFGAAPVAIQAWSLTASNCPIDGARLYYSDDGVNYTLITSSAFKDIPVPFTDREFSWSYAQLGG
jgi:hypothetical protein